MDYRAIDHRLLKVWREIAPGHAQVLIAVSGGVDSLFLADFLFRWRQLLKIEISLAHVHHGQKSNYRDQAFFTVADWALKRDLKLYSNALKARGRVVLNDKPSAVLRSEAELRQWRQQCMKQWVSDLELKTDEKVFVVTGHSSDDLLETRLLRLLRGTGPQGLRAMGLKDGRILRPLLRETKEKILAAAIARKIKWCEDPSNQKSDYLRNWIRQNWLQPLKKDHPDFLATLARSLDCVSERGATPDVREKMTFEKTVIDRRTLQILPRPEQRREVAAYFKANGLQNYTQGHIDEILKRLDISRKHHTFILLDRVCTISSDWIKLSQR